MRKFPTVLGADVPAYNLPGVPSGMKFTPEALAGIFLGTITKWNDPELTRSNPEIKLPDRDIVVAVRADGSGTTYVWTDYLAKVSKAWDERVGVGAWVSWPVGIPGRGNAGVSRIVQETPYSVGYVELAYALTNKLAYGSVRNQAGRFVSANLESVTEAARSVPNLPDDFRVSITNAPGANAYPISSFTWLLFYQNPSDKQRAKIMADFLKWALSDGQKAAPGLNYAPLPKPVIDLEMQAVGKIQL